MEQHLSKGIMDYELSNKIRLLVVLTSTDLHEDYLVKKLIRNFLSE